MPAEKNTYDLLKLIFNLLLIGLLIIVTFRVIESFLFGFFWAVMVVIATWPLMIKLQQRLFGRRILAVAVMTIILALVFVIPFGLIISSVTKNSSYLIEWVTNLSHQQIPTLDWLQNIPVMGSELHQTWSDLVDNDGAELMKQVQPHIGSVVSWLISQVANITLLIFHGGVMIIFSALLYLKGETVNKHITQFASRLSAQNGSYAVNLAGQAIRAVALGVVVTALVQALIAGLSLTLTNMPYPGLLTLIIFICCVAQLGPLLILIPSIIWQFWDGHTAFGIILIIVAVALTTLDSVMRAYLIKKGADLPFLLILCGVIGGLLGFGMMGLFIGPVVLALSYKLISAWVAEQN